MIKQYFMTALIAVATFSAGAQTYNWSQLSGAPFNGGKQDGIYFINQDTGWVVNGSGKIYRTINGGGSWIQQHNAPGTYFRAVAFMNNQVGFVGNIGTGYFPGVTDTNPLYKTNDGGNSWAPVTATITGTMPAGICAIDVVDENVVYAAGRVGSPAVVIKSTDGGENWVGIDLSAHCNMILDLHFISADTGYVFAGSHADITQSHASILRTTDGGQTWTNVYTSTRVYENVWKADFPSHDVGYGTVQSYDPGSTQRYVVKTTDAGLTWTELPLVNTGVREFGIGFLDENTGWVGGESGGFETQDGGQTWTAKNVGNYANKFSIVHNPDGSSTCYAVGLRVFKMSTATVGIAESVLDADQLLIYPNPCPSGSYISMKLDNIHTDIVKAELVAADGKIRSMLFDTHYMGTHESPFWFKLPEVVAGTYVIVFTDAEGNVYRQQITVV